MAALVLLTVPAGFIMVQPGIDRSLQNALFIYHKNVGVLLFVLVVLRLFVRWRNAPPPKPASVPAWQVRIADATHRALYALLVVQPIAGYVRVRAGGYPIEVLDALGTPLLLPQSEALADAAKAVHHWGGIAIAVLMALHIGAALFHAIVKRDGVFTRMWPPVGARRQ
jgi:cytochrome b561